MLPCSAVLLLSKMRIQPRYDGGKSPRVRKKTYVEKTRITSYVCPQAA
jgi:hypothetical protein